MHIKNIEQNFLAKYVCSQIKYFFPVDDNSDLDIIATYLDEALQRLEYCLNHVRMWKPETFDVMHSSQYCLFLYYLSNTIWRRERADSTCTKLFLLNKALNGIDCFYEIELPDVMFIGHSVGIVLAKAVYGNYFVIYQNSTVGRNYDKSPTLGEGVIMYPNSAIIGRCEVGDRSIISQGVSVINQNTEHGRIAFQSVGGSLVFKSPKHDILSDFFRSL